MRGAWNKIISKIFYSTLSVGLNCTIKLCVYKMVHTVQERKPVIQVLKTTEGFLSGTLLIIMVKVARVLLQTFHLNSSI